MCIGTRTMPLCINSLSPDDRLIKCTQRKRFGLAHFDGAPTTISTLMQCSGKKGMIDCGSVNWGEMRFANVKMMK